MVKKVFFLKILYLQYKIFIFICKITNLISLPSQVCSSTNVSAVRCRIRTVCVRSAFSPNSSDSGSGFEGRRHRSDREVGLQKYIFLVNSRGPSRGSQSSMTQLMVDLKRVQINFQIRSKCYRVIAWGM